MTFATNGFLFERPSLKSAKPRLDPQKVPAAASNAEDFGRSRPGRARPNDERSHPDLSFFGKIHGMMMAKTFRKRQTTSGSEEH